MSQEIEKSIKQSHQDLQNEDAKNWFGKLIQPTQYVGELYSINYETAKIQIHDNERKNAKPKP